MFWRAVGEIGYLGCNIGKRRSMEEERMREASVANSETGKENVFISGSSVGSRPGDWSLFSEKKFVGKQGMPVFLPEIGSEGVVVELEIVG